MSSENPTTDAYKAYPVRWFILALFIVYSASNAFQWTHLVIISSILEKYYHVSTFTISWTSLLFMVTYIPLIFPATWLLQKKGLRICVLIGSLGGCIGSWIKVVGSGRDRFLAVFVGQAIVAASQVCVLGMPPQLAATWFPASQVSSACAIGVFGNQLGVALGFIIPVLVVRSANDETDMDAVGSDIFYMHLTVGIISTVIFVLAVIFFKNAPPSPPSRAQDITLIKDNRGSTSEPDSFRGYLDSMKRLLTNKNYVLLLITYGLNVGVFYAISTILNTVIVKNYPGAEKDAGTIGLLIVVCGMAGSIVCGFILDKTHKFKPTTLVVYILSFLSMLVYTFTMKTKLQVVYVAASILGFFMTGYLPVGFEFASEITFPESEGTSSGLLNASAQIVGIVCTLVAGKLLDGDDRIANGILTCVLLVGACLTALIRPDYRRQNALHL